jgi:hypothetical protein
MASLALSPSDATYVRIAAVTGVLDARAARPLRDVLPSALATPCAVRVRYGAVA